MTQPKTAVGEQLIGEIATLSGLPVEKVTQEIESQLQEVGCDPKKATIDDLRRAIAAFLAETMGEFCDIESQDF